MRLSVAPLAPHTLLWILSILFYFASVITAKKTNYLAEYACEGKTLHIRCEQPGTLINVIRANYGRYSISMCNDHGHLDWRVDCTSHRSFYVIKNRCAQQSECTIAVNSDEFDDQCPDTFKYLEVHYKCILDPSTLNISLGNLTDAFADPDRSTNPFLDQSTVPSSSTPVIHTEFDTVRSPDFGSSVLLGPAFGHSNFNAKKSSISTPDSNAIHASRHPLAPLSNAGQSMPPKIIVPELAFPAPSPTPNNFPNQNTVDTSSHQPSSPKVSGKVFPTQGVSATTSTVSVSPPTVEHSFSGNNVRLPPSSSLFVKPQSPHIETLSSVVDHHNVSAVPSITLGEPTRSSSQSLENRFTLNLIAILLGSTALCACVLLFSLFLHFLYRTNRTGVQRKQLASIQLLIQLAIGFTLVMDHLSRSSDALPAITVGASHLFGSMLSHYLFCVWFQLLLLQTIRTYVRFHQKPSNGKHFAFNESQNALKSCLSTMDVFSRPAVAYPLVYLTPLLSIGFLATLRTPAPFYTLHFALSSTFTGNRAALSAAALHEARSQLLLALTPLYIVLAASAIFLLLCARLHWLSGYRSSLISCPIGCECGTSCKPHLDTMCTMPSGQSLQQPIFDNHMNSACAGMFTLPSQNRAMVSQMIRSQSDVPSHCIKLSISLACQASKYLLMLFSLSALTWALYLALLYQLLDAGQMSSQAFYVFAAAFSIFNLLQSILIARSLLTCRNKINSTLSAVGSASGSTGSSSVEPAIDTRFNFLPAFALKWIPSKLRSTSSPTPLISGLNNGLSSNPDSSNNPLCGSSNHAQNSSFCGQPPLQLIVPSAPSQQSVYFYSLEASQLPNVQQLQNRINTVGNQHALISTQQLQQLHSLHNLQTHSLLNPNGSVTLAHPAARTLNPSVRVTPQTLLHATHRASYPSPDAHQQMTAPASHLNGFQAPSHSFSTAHPQLQQEYEELRGPFDTTHPSNNSTAFTYGTLPLGASSANVPRAFKVSSTAPNVPPLPDVSMQTSVNAKRVATKDTDLERKPSEYQRDEDMYLYESVDSPQHCFYDTRSPIYYSDGNRQ